MPPYLWLLWRSAQNAAASYQRGLWGLWHAVIFPFPGDHLASWLFVARPRFSPLLVLLPFTWAMEAEQRLHVKEFIIQKMSRGLSVSQICHQELIFSFPSCSFWFSVKQQKDSGAFIKEILHLICLHPVYPSFCEKIKFISRSSSEVQEICWAAFIIALWEEEGRPAWSPLETWLTGSLSNFPCLGLTSPVMLPDSSSNSVTHQEYKAVYSLSTWPEGSFPPCSGCCCHLCHREKWAVSTGGSNPKGKTISWAPKCWPWQWSCSTSTRVQQQKRPSAVVAVYEPLQMNWKRSFSSTECFWQWMLHRKLSHAPAFSFPQERVWAECDPSMLSTNACPMFTFRECVSCSNSDRSVSSYSVRWTCVCCWVDGTAQYLLSPPRHPTGSWLLPLSCSSQRLAFSTAFQAEFPEGCWNLESSWLSVLLIFLPSFFSSPFLLFHSMLLAF